MFVCLRIPQFSAWASAQINPLLAQRPFAVGEHGQVIAPCPRAQALGITSGMSVGKARSRLDSLHILARDKSLESLAWNEVQRTLYGLTPKVEARKMGLLFTEIAPEKLAPLLHLWNRGELGVTVGCAADRATAHLAALLAPPGSTRVVKKDWEFAGKTPVESLLGEVSIATIEQLLFFGWKTLSAIRPLNRRQIEEQFNLRNMDGEVLFRFAQGAKCKENLRPVLEWRPPEEVAARIGFEFPATEPAEWEQGLADILIEACAEFGTRSAQTVEVTAQTVAGALSARRVLREPTNNPKTLSQPVHHALQEALRLLAPLPVVIQGLEIRLGNLVVPEVQIELWDDPHATRDKKLKGALERLDERLPDKVLKLVPHQTHSPFEEENFSWATALERLGMKRRATEGQSGPSGVRRHAVTAR